MKDFRLLLLISFVIFTGSFVSCDFSGSDSIALQKEASVSFSPLPENFFREGAVPSAEKVSLGRKLFFETSVSIDGKISCATCHPPQKHGADGLQKSIGNNGKLNPRNAPTVLNAAFQFSQHWRGDRKDVEDQALRALTGGASFGAPDLAFVEKKLLESERYRMEFAAAYPEDRNPVSAKNYADAIGAFERTLVSRSPFDSFLEGKTDALSREEQKGLSLFIKTGCASCHRGELVGGGSFQKFGVVKPYDTVLYKDGNRPSGEPDHGRMDVTGDEGDRDIFKVPGLRNVAKTAPYFHDGSVAELSRAVQIMGEVQLGKQLTDSEVGSIVSFLNSLTGKIPETFSNPE